MRLSRLSRLPFPAGTRDFVQGNEAVVRAAIMAGCRFFAGYPITPANEILENMMRLMPLVGGVALQLEDEIAALAAAIGASWTGVKSMTATSGPGFSLMMEGLGYAVMTETPVVIVDVQRGGPSTGQPTMSSQGDLLQAVWGLHGDQSKIVLSPWSAQEAFDLTIEAFNLSEEYRVPVILLMDGEVARLRELVKIPEPDELEVKYRAVASPEQASLPYFDWLDTKVPPMPLLGRGHAVHVTGLTHDERGYPMTNEPEIHEKLVRRLVEKIEGNARKIFSYDALELEEAEVVVVAYGIAARSAAEAVRILRRNGVRAGLLRLKTLWPIDGEVLRRALSDREKVVVVEMSLGQLHRLIRLHTCCDSHLISVCSLGGKLPEPEDIARAASS
ncbi:MAG: 2-oxoacid:acceptor oxidoreductase subunit alpha [Fervidicoccaceae archaeon]